MSIAAPASSRMSDEEFEFFKKYLATRYGLRIANEKRVLLESRIISRVNALRLNSIQEYVEYTFRSKHAADEYPFFVDQVTTHKTFFFRENYQFQFLESILSSYCAKISVQRPINVWSAGCSTGEEVYTIGMTLQEKKAEIPNLDYRIIGTDISIPSLKKAANACYSIAESENIPEVYKQKYFSLDEKGPQRVLNFRSQEITSRTKLGSLNLNNKVYNLPCEFDFIFCRNVTIYFDAKTRGEVLGRMVAKLRPGGYLFLGHSETALGTSLPIRSIQPTIYQKITIA